MRAKPVSALAALAGMLSLAACATPGAQAPSSPILGNAAPAEPAVPQTDLTELPPQNLIAGECATFFWSADTQNRFLAFENETRGYANIFVDGAAHRFAAATHRGSYVAGDLYRRSFVDPARNLDIQISGEIGDPLPSGQRIDRVVMRITQPDGQILVIPMIGHHACRNRAQMAG